MKPRTPISLAAIASLVMLGSACSTRVEPSKAPEKVSLRLAWVYDMAEVGIFVAKDKGFYEKEGIDLEIKPGGFGLDPLKLIAAGSDAFGVGGAVNLLLAREKGMPLVAIGAEFQHTPVGFIVRKDSGIKNFPDFRGRKVGVQTGADTDTLYRAMLAKFGMSAKDVREVPIQFDPTPFVSRQIDVLPGYVSNQPITLKNQGVETAVITAASQGLNAYGNVYFVSDKTLKERPDLVLRFIRATKAGWEYAMNNRDGAISAMKARSKDFGDADLQAIHAAVMPFIRPDEPSVPLLGMTRSRWEATYDVLVKAGLSTQAKPVDEAFRQVDNGRQ
jgi:NitT/TauT family transport system substrate-binding protein